ncbi:MAG: HPP family protein [Actinomycetota bacterium]|nr:HPP family protein [Actinomycetota bacterium]
MESQRPHPLGGGMSDVLAGLASRLGFDPFAGDWRARTVLGAFAFVTAGLSFAIVGTLAVMIHQPFVFPSLGPTAFLLFYRPLARSASPRSVILGHLIGVTSGYVALVAFGRTQAGPALQAGVPAKAVGAAALSLALTATLMVLLDAPHPPAAATTLIISLGFLTRPNHFIVLLAAVVLLAAQDVAVNRLAGLDMPLWAPRESEPEQ